MKVLLVFLLVLQTQVSFARNEPKEFIQDVCSGIEKSVFSITQAIACLGVGVTSSIPATVSYMTGNKKELLNRAAPDAFDLLDPNLTLPEVADILSQNATLLHAVALVDDGEMTPYEVAAKIIATARSNK